MTRQYMNERWCVRCSRQIPTPYLKRNIRYVRGLVVDVGCGNGRNSRFVADKGFIVYSFDMAGDFGDKLVLGREPLPLPSECIDTFLANYVFMFLNTMERTFLVEEIKRTSKIGSRIIVELYPAKDSHTPTEDAMLQVQEELIHRFGWIPLRNSKGKFILERRETAEEWLNEQ